MKTLSLTAATDNQLVNAFQQGDNRALEVLLTRYKDKIFTSIKVLVKDTYLAEDLFQEVFIKIIDTLRANRYNEEGKFLPWAMRIAHNLCIDHIRRVKRTPIVTTNDDSDMFDFINVSEDYSDKAIMKAQRHERVHILLDMLPEDQREIIVLRHFADMSFKEIAEITNISINTALGRVRYALINLRKIIEEKQLASCL